MPLLVFCLFEASLFYYDPSAFVKTGNYNERRKPKARPRKSSRSKKHKISRSAGEEIESKLGFDIFSEGDKRLGWLLTFAPVLGWQQTAAKIGTQRGAASTQWLNERISLARYARTIRKF